MSQITIVKLKYKEYLKKKYGRLEKKEKNYLKKIDNLRIKMGELDEKIDFSTTLFEIEFSEAILSILQVSKWDVTKIGNSYDFIYDHHFLDKNNKKKGDTGKIMFDVAKNKSGNYGFYDFYCIPDKNETYQEIFGFNYHHSTKKDDDLIEKNYCNQTLEQVNDRLLIIMQNAIKNDGKILKYYWEVN